MGKRYTAITYYIHKHEVNGVIDNVSGHYVFNPPDSAFILLGSYPDTTRDRAEQIAKQLNDKLASNVVKQQFINPSITFGEWLTMLYDRDDTPSGKSYGNITGEVARAYRMDDCATSLNTFRQILEHVMLNHSSVRMWFLNGLFSAYVEYLCRIELVDQFHTHYTTGLNDIMDELGLLAPSQAREYLDNACDRLRESGVI